MMFPQEHHSREERKEKSEERLLPFAEAKAFIYSTERRTKLTIGEVISDFRDMVPSAPDDAVLVKWLSEIETILVSELLLTHEEPPEGAKNFDGYRNTDGREVILFAPDAFCRLYVEYLAMKYYIFICDTKRYNAFAELFYNSYGNFADSVNREKKPLSRASVFKTAEVS